MTTATTRQEAINRHYGGEGAEGDLVARIRRSLAAAGLAEETLTREQVATLEEFHIGGREATRELARLAGFGAGERVLDIGAGLGGPARTLAAEAECRVVALELTREYCRAARWLNEALGMTERVEVREGDALALPFEDGVFDGVVLEHVTMNIPDKERLMAECARVLRPGGRLALYEICRSGDDPLEFPVPWAAEPSLSHLATPAELREVAADAGLRTERWEDVTDEAVERLRGMLAEGADRPADAPPPVGLNVVIGEALPERGATLMRNFERGRLRVVRGVLTTG